MKKGVAENWPQWFAAFWPSAARRWLAMQGYRTLGLHHQVTLADIALRNNVFAPIRETDPHLAAIAEGRRQCALEIFKLAKVDTAVLFEKTKQFDRNRGDTA
jgi:hypothetical protein